jgi:hypothetical protein
MWDYFEIHVWIRIIRRSGFAGFKKIADFREFFSNADRK